MPAGDPGRGARGVLGPPSPLRQPPVVSTVVMPLTSADDRSRRRRAAILAIAAPAVAAGAAAYVVAGVGSGLAAAAGGLFAGAVIAQARGRAIAVLAQRLRDREPLASVSPLAAELAPVARAAEAAARRTAEATRGERARLAGVLDAIADAVILVDGARRVAHCNRAARALLGAVSLGRDLSETLRDPAVLDGVSEALDAGTGERTEIALAGAVARSLAVTVLPLEAPGAGAVISFRDLTGARRTEQLRVDFVANASHEIRSPLASIVGLIETLRGPARGDREAEEKFLAMMAGEAQRMTRLVDDLLSLSRIELREHAPPTDRVALAEVVDEVVATLAPKAAARDMEIALRVQRPGPVIVGDQGELTLALGNLVSNALTYGRPASTVTIAIDAGATMPGRERAALALSVADQGDGIPAEYIPRLTERFYRVDKGRSRTMGGTGLGLAIVKHVANRHGGVLDIQSTPGRGSVFTLYFRAPPSSNGHATVI